MKKVRSLALAGLLFVPVIASAQFATSVIAYDPGTGFAAGFTNTSAAIGAPTSSATPFAPPFAKSQLISAGTNGALTVQLDPPVINNPSDPFGLDFIVFGNSFFVITNGNFSGGGITSGAIGGNNTGSTRVEISADGINWFTLNPALAPTLDAYFPTDGAGDPHVPVDPSLTAASFGGSNLTGIRALYNGSAGGSGYDLSWAQDTNGSPVNLPIVRYVRLHVLSSRSEIDAVSLVRGSDNVIADDFLNDPAQNGWKIFGNPNLFQWTNQSIAVTWDSTQPNSYLYKPLGTILAIADDFNLSFDLRLNDAIAFNYGAPIAVGLFRLNDATNVSFSRGGGHSPNLFEFNFFPDTGFGDSIDATLKDVQDGYAGFYFAYDNLPLDPGVLFHVELAHAAGSPTITGAVYTNGQLYTSLPLSFNGSPTNFYLDTVSISSYHDDGFGDSVLAHGTVDNILVAFPPLPLQSVAAGLTGGVWQAQLASRSNWVYTLQRTVDLQTWTDVVSAAGNGTNLFLQDVNPPANNALYRVKADRP